MKLVYKKPYRSRYEVIVTELSIIFPDRLFRVKTQEGEHGDHALGVEVCVSNPVARILWGGSWRELDLEAMRLEYDRRN